VLIHASLFPVIRALFSREGSSAFFAAKIRAWPRVVVVAMVGVGLLAAIARADLVVLNAGMSGDRHGTGVPMVLRFDPSTGARLGWFGHESEDYLSMSLTSAGEVCVTADTLGDDEIQRFSSEGQYLGNVARATAGRFAGCSARTGWKPLQPHAKGGWK